MLNMEIETSNKKVYSNNYFAIKQREYMANDPIKYEIQKKINAVYLKNRYNSEDPEIRTFLESKGNRTIEDII
jgi:ATP-dependent protease ClpP protease subunit